MWGYILMYLGACLPHSENFEIATHSDRDKYKGTYTNPNAWPMEENFGGESMESPYGVELLQSGLQSCSKWRSVEKTDAEYLTLRRFINLLLKRANFEDLEGNAVSLESIPDVDGSVKLIMSLDMYASREELNILYSFGRKKLNLSAREVDEVITNIFSSEIPSQYQRHSRSGNWMSDIVNMVADVTKNVDAMSVIYFMVVAYIIWSINVAVRRQCSWKMLFMCFALPAVVWEFSKVYEEETIKHLSEQLRHDKIPDHCYGIDKREWWERLWNKRSDVDCYEHHLRKMSHPVLKISILKVALSQVQLILDLVVKFIRDVTDLAPGEWFFNRWVNKAFITSSLTVAVIVIGSVFIVVKFGGIISIPFLFSIKKDSASANPGSRVQPISPVDEFREPVKPPPRRRNRNGKRSAVVDGTDGKAIRSIEHNVGSRDRDSNALGNGKEGNSDSDSVKEKEKGVPRRTQSGGSLSLEAKDEVLAEGNGSEEGNYVEENGSESGNSVDIDTLGGGDAPSPTS